MVLKEWGEIRQLYQKCRPRPYRLIWSWHKARVYWYIWALVGLSLLSVFVSIFDFVRSLYGYPSSLFGYPTSSFGYMTGRLWVTYFGILLSLLFAGLFSFTIEKAFASELESLYTIHGLKHYPWGRRSLYLHYACFLCGLADRLSASRETIAQLRSFADVAGPPPPPESRLLQPAYIVPYIVLLNALILELLKQADLLKEIGGLILILCVYALVAVYFVLRVWYGVTNWVPSEERTVQRFLQWAEGDIEEARLLKPRRPHMGQPGDPES